MNQMMEQPVPQGKYLPAVRHADLIYTSGMTPRKAGILLHSGRIRTKDSIEAHKEAVRLATKNAFSAAQACLRQGEKISLILQLTAYLNAEQGFTDHAKIADYASDFLIECLGENGMGSRVAIGVASLPSDAPIEVALVASVS